MVEKKTHAKDSPTKSSNTGKKQTASGGKKKDPAKRAAAKSADKAIKDAENKFLDMQARYVRLSAEFDNFRKRTLREKADLMKFAGEDILVSLLPVLDDFDRAVQSLDEARDLNSLKDGIMLIYNKFYDFLKQKGMQEMASLHEAFDTDCHEALTKIPVPEKKLKGKVVDVIEKGYMLNGKVVRYSKVVVGE